jgi:hypothetical protein
LNFGGQSQVVIPNQSLLNETYLHLELPPVVANQSLVRGWGYQCLASINFLFGSSNVSQLVLPKHVILQTVMSQCETAEKRSELFRLAGQEQLVATPGINQTADILLPLPWSSMCGEHAKLPFDTSMLNNPITIQIQFDNANSIYGGTGTLPTAFTKAQLYFRQGDLANKDQSLKYMLMKQPDLMYSYPFIHHQPFNVRFQGSTDSNNPAQLNLLSFINADLIHITFGCVRDSRQSPTSQSTPNQFAYDDLSNIQLKFNGLVMYDAPGKLYKVYNMKSLDGGSYWFNSLVAAGNVNPFTSSPIDSYIVSIDFARIKSMCFEGRYQNVWRIGNNVITLTLNTETTEQYNLFATYHYNAVAEVQSGETRIYFD